MIFFLLSGMGAEAVLALMDATPETEACVVSLVIFWREKKD